MKDNIQEKSLESFTRYQVRISWSWQMKRLNIASSNEEYSKASGLLEKKKKKKKKKEKFEILIC